MNSNNFIIGDVVSVDAEVMGIIVSLSGGALLANIVSVSLYVGDTLKSKR